MLCLRGEDNARSNGMLVQRVQDMKLGSALDNLVDRETREIQSAVDFLTLLRRKYENARGPLMNTVTASAKIVVQRQLDASGIDIQESPAGYTWRKRKPSSPVSSDAQPAAPSPSPSEPSSP